MSPAAADAFRVAIEEARAINVTTVGSEHLLLGLMRANDGIAARALHNLGLRIGEMRSAVMRILEVGVDPVTEGL
jgi:ATP-dependent Clp protease ATP-binding subunit ClpC